MRIKRDMWQVTSDKNPLARGASCHSSLVTRHWSRSDGVALVITLMLLAVITFMAVTFLVVSRSETGAVKTKTDQNTALLAAEGGLERAKAELFARLLAVTNEFNYDLMVSTNYINWMGFDPAAGADPTNVNFEYTTRVGARAGTPLTAAQREQVIASLLYNPRVPVVVTNRFFANSNEFRFYLDLNRNGRYDANGYWPVIGFNGGYLHLATNNNVVSVIENSNPVDAITNYFVGDPEWIGILEHPDWPHSASNRFLSRIAYIIVPVGKTLDINYIHNQALGQRLDTFGRNFRRNMGSGSAEINLAAFLYDLNTNLLSGWGAGPYTYSVLAGVPTVRGNAFVDAGLLLSHRYAGNYNNLASALQFFGPNANALRNDGGDEYIDGSVTGQLMTGTTPPDLLPNNDNDPVQRPWVYTDNTNHFFTTQDFFDRTKTGTGTPSFADRLTWAGTNVDSYSRYTFYRMFDQLGTDSAPETGKLNINWDNMVRTNQATGTRSATNLLAWRPVEFFGNVAARLLVNAGYGPNVVSNYSTGANINIQIYPGNFYTPSVHRLLQLAANIYDATTNRIQTGYPHLPSVFRPIFRRDTTNVFIVGYVEETDARLARLGAAAPPMLDLQNGVDLGRIRPLGVPINPSDGTEPMVYGMPVVIGAKKGFPNFNNLSMQTQVQVTRKLEFFRRNINDRYPSETNQMYTVAISNIFGIEAWNSYSNVFPRNLTMIIGADTRATVTNEFGNMLLNPLGTPPGTSFTHASITNIPGNSWTGFSDANHAQYSFRVPVLTNFLFLTNSTYSESLRRYVPLTGFFEKSQGRFPAPHWWLNLRTRLRFVLVDTSVNRIVDYVNLDSSEEPVDLTDALAQGGKCGDPFDPDGYIGSMFCTNRGPNISSDFIPTYGIQNQIGVGLFGKRGPYTDVDWNSFVGEYPVGVTRDGAVNFFRTNLLALPPWPGSDVSGPLYKTNHFFAPFAPTRNIYFFTSWQANDPLVHYTIGDLRSLEDTNRVQFNTDASPTKNFGRQLNQRYEPWTGTLLGHTASRTLYDLALKDPLVGRSDDWDFPTNKFPNIGWLGRVHRGTPWQTVYLKAARADLNTWRRWSGDSLVVINWDGKGSTNSDAELTHPIRDHDLLDVFTTAINENATRGQLPVSQTNLAAWSAVLSGVIALTNTVNDADFASDPFRPAQFAPWVVEPAGIYDPNLPPPVVRIVNAINDVRATNSTRRVFTRLGDVLNVPELTVGSSNQVYYVGTYPNGYWAGVSPFVNLGDPATMNQTGTDPADALTRQQRFGVSDAVYERIPQQILSLVRLDPTPRFVVYAFGQALRPAEHSIITSSRTITDSRGGKHDVFGMCTNYQVVGESAIRAVVRASPVAVTNNNTITTNYTVLTEQFNILPPD